MLTLDRSLVDETGFNPYYQLMDREQYIDLASNNYLGLAEDDRVKKASIAAIVQFGTSMCGTPIATGYISLFQQLEKRLSAFAGLEETIIFPSCYQANNGIFTTMATKDDLIIVDRYAHSSLIQGIRAAGCKISPFLHNDIEHLERILSRSHRYKQIFVVTESVFSTEGSIAPVKELSVLCDRFNAMLIIDDSHGIGVLGKSGGGILEHSGLTDFKGIYTASLGKALANSGGMVAGKRKVIEVLRHYCPHLIFSTAITPAALGGINGALDVIESDFEVLSKKMWNYKERISKSGDYFINSQAPINAIPTGNAKNTLMLAKKLFEHGIFTTPFIEPSVPKNEGVVRMIAGAGLTEQQVQYAIEKIKVSV